MILYNLVILLYGAVIKLASLKNQKAKFWVNGRKNWRKNLSEKLKPFSSHKKIWVHCASLGEFEQGRPIIEAIRNKYPEIKIVLTFFSPSGYEIRKNYEGADVIAYLPLDTKRNAEDFLDILKPQMAVFIKYEFWINFLHQLKKLKIETYLVSAVFKDHHPFFKWYGSIFRGSLLAFKKLLVQDKNSVDLLNSIGLRNVEICGDTRFDRVSEIKENFKPINEIESFKGSSKLIIAGSTWPKDEDFIIDAFRQLKTDNIKFVIVPHDIEDKLLTETANKLKDADLSYCFYTEGVNSDAQVLIINTIGLLSRLYYYCDLAYVGGGFQDGIHNILEPAVYRKPVCFYGNNYKKFNEAVDLIGLKAAFNVNSKEEFLNIINVQLFDAIMQKETSAILENYFKSNINITEKVLKAINL